MGSCEWEHEEAEFFGEGDELLFGVTYHPLAQVLGAVLVASPIFEEMVKNYRKEVLLARALAAHGAIVQRFHYRGSGHSDGDSRMLTFDSMREDLHTAAAHLRKRAKDAPLVLVGTRLGALAAMHNNAHGDPLALWEPIIDPATYVREINRTRLMRAAAGRTTSRSMSDDLVDATGADVMGYELTRRFLESLPTTSPSQPPPTALLVQLRRGAALNQEYARLVQQWTAAGARVSTMVAKVGGSWWFEEDALLGDWTHESPRAYINATCDWIVHDAFGVAGP